MKVPTVILFCSCLALSVGCGGTEYKEYSLDDGHIRFQFPTEEDAEFMTEGTEAANKYGQRDSELYGVTNGNVGYVVSASKFRMSKAKFSAEELFNSGNAAGKMGDIDLGKAKSADRFGLPGRRIESSGSGTKVLFNFHVSEERVTMYTVGVTSRSEEDFKAAKADIDYFLDNVIID